MAWLRLATSSHSITSSARASTVANLEAERFGSLEVNYKFVFSRGLHRQVGRLLALEDTIHIAGRALVLVDLIRPVGDEATPAGIGSVSQATKNAQAARDARNDSVQ